MHMPMTLKEVGSPDNVHPIGPDGKINFEDDTDHVTIWKVNTHFIIEHDRINGKQHEQRGVR